jgi:Tfp pilus assembly protein PilN
VIRSNLASRPFYNERAAHAVLVALALAVALVTGFNVYRLVSLSSRNTALSAEIRSDDEAAARHRQQAAAVRGRIDAAQLEAVIAGAREANALIDRRTFSWTEFFNIIERTLPENVMLTSVSPAVAAGQTVVTMGVLARGPEDLDDFMERLEASRSFRGVLPRTEDLTEDGLHRVVLTAQYLGPSAASPAGASEGP